MLVFILIHGALSSQSAALEPSVADEYYGVDDGRELQTREYSSYPSAKHRTATAYAGLNRTWLQRRTLNYSRRFWNHTRRGMNYSTFGRGKLGSGPYMPGMYRPLLGSHRYNTSLAQRSAEHLYDLAEMKKKEALGTPGDAGKWSSQGPSSGNSHTPTVCCEAEVAECLACKVHMPVVYYCRRHPLSPGCAEVRQRSSPKTRLPPTSPPS